MARRPSQGACRAARAARSARRERSRGTAHCRSARARAPCSSPCAKATRRKSHAPLFAATKHMPLRTVTATRYVTPLREGGSLPAVVEADDEGTYVLKFRGAGQGAKALIAELVGGELARA